MKNLIYIYNIQQAGFYMLQGLIPVATGIHNITRKKYYVFNREESQEAFKKWCNRNK